MRCVPERTLSALVAAVTLTPLLLAGTACAMDAGVNLSGLEWNAGTIPGAPNWDYPVPTGNELAYYQSQGIMLIRLPILWERLQPTLLSEPGVQRVGGEYLKTIKALIREAGRRGMGVVVDVHDYGGYAGQQIGGGVVTYAMFTALWQALATHLHGIPGLVGYDLMNEPNNMPDPTVWPQAAQLAVAAIRTVDMATPIYVEGDDWASAGDWWQNNGSLAISDPANRIVYEAHVYGDQDNSGTHFNWAEVAAAGVTVDTIADRVSNFTSWCTAGGVQCMIGEVGVGNDDPNWNLELANGLAVAQAAGLQAFTYWAGGPWWGTYPMSIEPANGQNAVQMAVVALYSAP